VQSIVNSDNEEDMQIHLLELLGYDCIEFVFEIVQNKDKIRSALKKKVNVVTTSLLGYQPTLGPSVRVSKKQAVQFQTDGLRDAREKALAGNANDPEYLRNLKPHQKYGIDYSVYPHVYGRPNPTSALSDFGRKLALPPHERYDSRDFEEFVIPYDNSPLDYQIDLITIDQFNPIFRDAFPGYDSLNRMQSLVYPSAYLSNENLLVSAPTGAGKTDVAMMTVLRTIEDYIEDGKIDLKSFKIVYIAPMKALAAEVAAKFSKRLAYLGIQVKEWTGDMQLSKTEILSTQMFVSTPEKYDVITRKAGSEDEFFSKVQLLIIDEVHLLHDERGPVIESIVARTLREVEMSQRVIRIVGLSATLPNFIDVASFLRVNHYTGMYYFDSKFRPVPLTQGFIGIKGSFVNQVNDIMNRVSFEKVRLELSGYAVNGFCKTRLSSDGFCSLKK
jgi:hypothetical protein